MELTYYYRFASYQEFYILTISFNLLALDSWPFNDFISHFVGSCLDCSLHSPDRGAGHLPRRHVTGPEFLCGLARVGHGQLSHHGAAAAQVQCEEQHDEADEPRDVG